MPLALFGVSFMLGYWALLDLTVPVVLLRLRPGPLIAGTLSAGDTVPVRERSGSALSFRLVVADVCLERGLLDRLVDRTTGLIGEL